MESSQEQKIIKVLKKAARSGRNIRIILNRSAVQQRHILRSGAGYYMRAGDNRDEGIICGWYAGKNTKCEDFSFKNIIFISLTSLTI